MKRDILNSPRLLEIKKKRQKLWLKKIYVTVGVILALFVLLAGISNLKRLNISAIEITGNKIIDTEILTTEISENLNQKYLWVLPKTNIFLYPRLSLSQVLKNKFPRISRVDMNIQTGQKLHVDLDERKPAYVWCKDGNDPCYFLDDTGFIFDIAPYFSGEVYFRFYGHLSDTANPVGQYVGGNKFPEFVKLKTMLSDLKLKPVALASRDAEDSVIYLESVSGELFGPEIRFKNTDDYTKIVENLQSALSTEPMYSEFKNKYASLLYIDLRFGNKVYFKFK